jgi:U3 small nucleolar RNA-associated protein 3
MSDAPELLALLAELKESLTEVRGRIGPVLREVSSGGLATAAGLSYLEAKHLLLLQYCMCIVAYLMIKAEGKSVNGHPVLTRWGGASVCGRAETGRGRGLGGRLMTHHC